MYCTWQSRVPLRNLLLDSFKLYSKRRSDFVTVWIYRWWWRCERLEKSWPKHPKSSDEIYEGLLDICSMSICCHIYTYISLSAGTYETVIKAVITAVGSYRPYGTICQQDNNVSFAQQVGQWRLTALSYGDCTNAVARVPGTKEDITSDGNRTWDHAQRNGFESSSFDSPLSTSARLHSRTIVSSSICYFASRRERVFWAQIEPKCANSDLIIIVFRDNGHCHFRHKRLFLC